MKNILSIRPLNIMKSRIHLYSHASEKDHKRQPSLHAAHPKGSTTFDLSPKINIMWLNAHITISKTALKARQDFALCVRANPMTASSLLMMS